MEPDFWWGHGFDFMWLIPLFFLVVCVFFMRAMFGQGSHGCGFHGDSEKHKDDAQDILDKRYANGEISKDEYEEMKRTLSSKTSRIT